MQVESGIAECRYRVKEAEPGSLAYYGGPDQWHKLRRAAQESLEPYVFEPPRTA